MSLVNVKNNTPATVRALFGLTTKNTITLDDIKYPGESGQARGPIMAGNTLRSMLLPQSINSFTAIWNTTTIPAPESTPDAIILTMGNGQKLELVSSCALTVTTTEGTTDYAVALADPIQINVTNNTANTIFLAFNTTTKTTISLNDITSLDGIELTALILAGNTKQFPLCPPGNNSYIALWDIPNRPDRGVIPDDMILTDSNGVKLALVNICALTVITS